MATAKLLEKESYLKIGKKPMVILPLEEWEQIKEFIEDREEAERFNQAVSDTENQEIISFKKIKEELKLP